MQATGLDQMLDNPRVLATFFVPNNAAFSSFFSTIGVDPTTLAALGPTVKPAVTQVLLVSQGRR